MNFSFIHSPISKHSNNSVGGSLRKDGIDMRDLKTGRDHRDVIDEERGIDPLDMNKRYAAVRDYNYYIDRRGPNPVLIHGMRTWEHQDFYALLVIAEKDLAEYLNNEKEFQK